ncbi:triose-phosphate isomerase [Kaarinaea lacus]
MRQPLVAGNWKLNGSKQSISQLLEGILGGIQEVKKAEVAVCPPSVYLQQVTELLKDSPVQWGAQNVSEHASGAYTGEVAAPMLVEFGCKYTIIGHSERRSLFGETDEQIVQKFVALKNAGIVPILCVGELLEEREAGNTEEVVGRQVDAVLNVAGIEQFENAVIAYEPVWAIGTGMTATPAQAQDVHAFIRQKLAEKDNKIADGVQILYGGSVKPDNAEELFSQPDIDGGLIGGASLDADGFLSICCAAN